MDQSEDDTDGTAGDIDPGDEKVVINVGGIRHEILVSSLIDKRGTRLCNLAHKHIKGRKEEYFFNRHPGVFSSVMDYYRSGRHTLISLIVFFIIAHTVGYPSCVQNYPEDCDVRLDRIGYFFKKEDTFDKIKCYCFTTILAHTHTHTSMAIAVIPEGRVGHKRRWWLTLVGGRVFRRPLRHFLLPDSTLVYWEYLCISNSVQHCKSDKSKWLGPL